MSRFGFFSASSVDIIVASHTERCGAALRWVARHSYNPCSVHIRNPNKKNMESMNLSRRGCEPALNLCENPKVLARRVRGIGVGVEELMH